MSDLTVRDIGLLREYGFEAGFSGTTWFGKDKNGVLYQAVSTDDNDTLAFYMEETRIPTDLNREDLETCFDKESSNV